VGQAARLTQPAGLFFKGTLQSPFSLAVFSAFGFRFSVFVCRFTGKKRIGSRFVLYEMRVHAFLSCCADAAPVSSFKDQVSPHRRRRLGADNAQHDAHQNQRRARVKPR
jgi:hypothetical protein